MLVSIFVIVLLLSMILAIMEIQKSGIEKNTKILLYLGIIILPIICVPVYYIIRFFNPELFRRKETFRDK